MRHPVSLSPHVKVGRTLWHEDYAQEAIPLNLCKAIFMVEGMGDIWVSESSKTFEDRILAMTGKHLCELENGTAEGLLGGHIFCTRNTSSGREYVYGTDPGEVNDDGVMVYSRFFWYLTE